MLVCVRHGQKPSGGCSNINIDQVCTFDVYFKAAPNIKGVVTPKRKSLDAYLHLVANNSFCLIDLLLFVPINSYGHVGTLDVERDVKQ